MASNNVIRIQIKRFSFYKCNSPFIYCNFSQFNNYKAALRAQPRINALDLAFIHMKYPFYIYTKHPKLEAWHSGTINLPHFASTIARRTSRNLCLNWIWKEKQFLCVRIENSNFGRLLDQFWHQCRRYSAICRAAASPDIAESWCGIAWCARARQISSTRERSGLQSYYVLGDSSIRLSALFETNRGRRSQRLWRAPSFIYCGFLQL